MIATLTSDYGHGDTSVAIAKAILLKQNPELKIVDLTHDSEPGSLSQCSYLFKTAFRFFTENSVHISLFNVLHSLPMVVLLTKVEDQIIVSADNGFLGFTFPNQKLTIWKYEHSESENYAEWLTQIGKLIHELEQSNADLTKIKLEAYTSKIEYIPVQPIVKEHSVECQILHVDKRGNVALNITENVFETVRNGRKFSISAPGIPNITKITTDYSTLTSGERFCMFNSSGYLELRVKDNNASDLYGLFPFEINRKFFNILTIEFYA